MNFINRAIDCSIFVFIQCRFQNNLKLLTIEGDPSLEQLKNAFEMIETEYNDICGNRPAQLGLMNRVNKQIGRNKTVEATFFILDEFLKRIFEPIPADEIKSDDFDLYMSKHINRMKSELLILKDLGISLQWTKDITKFKSDIESAKIREKSNDVKLIEMEKELKDVEQKATSDTKYTLANFYDLIHAVQRSGYTVSEKETNLYSFGVMVNRFYEMTKKQQ